ncbi:hypothetical protein [Spiroplasma endosymbiont of Virgichneumon dumeticola]|uniref:hypothetical protein n=1 Tax=Spiroplasma endosymbiont of Virgichneumon dumeticola TaxID=3139323 RepID=UPI0035C889EE
MYWIREMAEEIVEREELGGKTFKFKKDRNNYIKEIMQEIKIEKERIAFERDSVPCYECHQKVLPWKKLYKWQKIFMFVLVVCLK